MNWEYDYNYTIATGAGVDSTAGLQAAINTVTAKGNGLVLTRDYYVKPNGDSGGILTLPSGAYIKHTLGAAIRLLPHSSNWYQLYYCNGVNNITIEDADLDGNLEQNSASDPSGTGVGIGIAIYGGSNITLINPKCRNFWSDGLYMSYTPQNVTILNPFVSKVRRNGMSIVSGNNVLVENPVYVGVGTQSYSVAPVAACDIEPDSNADQLINIRIISPLHINCNNGHILNLGALPGPVAQAVSVTISDLKDIGCTGVAIGTGSFSKGSYTVSGHTTFNRPTFVHSAVGNAGPSAPYDNSITYTVSNAVTIA